MENMQFVLSFITSNHMFCGLFAICITSIVVFISTKFIFKDLPQGLTKKEAGENVDTDSITTGTAVSKDATDGGASDKETNDEKKVDDAGDKATIKEHFCLDDDVDPVQFCEHLQSEVKKARHRVATREIRNNLTKEEIDAERDIQSQQLEEIFKLMAKQNEKFGVAGVDEIKEQMKLYA